MHNKEKQVEQLLVNAKQSLDFLRTVLDDLFLKRDGLKPNVLNRLLISQQNYKRHKAVLANIETLLSKRKFQLPEILSKSLANSLRKRITTIIEEAVELDRLR